MQNQIENLNYILDRVSKASSISQKINILDKTSDAINYFTQLQPYLNKPTVEQEFALKSLLSLGQGPIVFHRLESVANPRDSIGKILEILLQLEKVYHSIGGIIGYHLTILNFISVKKDPNPCNSIRYLKPIGIDLSENTPAVYNYVNWGIQAIPIMGEIYPVGGAGDRLGLVETSTGKPMPAAKLNFMGITLLERLFQDLLARERLYSKATGRHVITPVALMTSHEKDNHRQILELCEEKKWFGRPQESIRFFIQPRVPVITIDGNWSMKAPLELTLKPGGHGLLWKLALEAGIFDWMESQNRKKLLIRQINNPVAGMDSGLLAFAGVGCHANKTFGFASCPRLLNTSEGMDVVIEKETKNGFEYCLTNVEYTDFEQKGLKDIPERPNSPYSAFPSNTNILFADIQAIREAVKICPLPGLLINMKNKVPSVDPQGNTIQVAGGRLESTMQNIADVIIEKSDKQLNPSAFENFKSYITYNLRRKTISVTKALYESGKEMTGTPEGCLYEMLENYEDLFKNSCFFQLPPLGNREEFLQKGPPFFISIAPVLGPLFSLIGGKINQGILHYGAELQLDIDDLEIFKLNLHGSLRIVSKNLEGKCHLRNVKIDNAGIDRQATKIYWSNDLIRLEECYIEIEGNGEFVAENVTIRGKNQIHVPHGHRVTAIQQGNDLFFQQEEIILSKKY